MKLAALALILSLPMLSGCNRDRDGPYVLDGQVGYDDWKHVSRSNPTSVCGEVHRLEMGQWQVDIYRWSPRSYLLPTFTSAAYLLEDQCPTTERNHW